jgi:hypothetical protein
MGCACSLFNKMTMRRIIFCIIAIMSNFTFAFPQITNDSKRGDIWVVGYRRAPDVQDYLAKFDFSSGSLDVDTFYTSTWQLRATSTISDTSGNLLLVFTGCAIANAQGKAIKNSANMPPDPVIQQLYCPNDYPLPQTLMLLTDPKSDTLYYALMSGARYQSTVGFSTYGLYLSHLSVHEVLEKNTQLFPFEIFSAHLAACRHANGRDWWVVVNKLQTNQYYKYLIDPSGVQGPFVQSIGMASTKPSNGSGQAVFSPDGTRYVRFSDRDDMLIFDFDRCSGELSNYTHVDVPGNEEFNINSGVAISPSSEFAYAFCGKTAYQLNLLAPDIQNSLTLIGTWDGTLVNGVWATYFNVAALAPDGKIYSTVPGSNPYLHIVHQPDLPAPACQFEQHAMLLPEPVWNSNSMPNLPNYRLGPAVGGPCDSLTTDVKAPVEDVAWQLAPNPTTGVFYLTLPDVGNYRLRIVNTMGSVVQELTLPGGQQTIRLNEVLPNGTYWVQWTGTAHQSNGQLKVSLIR